MYVAGNLGLSKVKVTPNTSQITPNITGAVGVHLIYNLKPNIA